MTDPRDLSRREFVRACALATAALASSSISGCRSSAARTRAASATGPAGYEFSLDQDWLFGGKFNADALSPDFDDRAFSRVTLPHCVANLSWQNWDPAAWEDTWIYRRHFGLPKEWRGLRVFVQFDGVMVGATPVINGRALPSHLGGYLPFACEITDGLAADNALAVIVDSRWSNVPPEGSPRGPGSIDYLEPGGIIRSVRLRAVPQIFISDLFAKPVNVLEAGRRVEVVCSIDAARLARKPVDLQIELRDGGRVLRGARETLRLEKTGQTQVALNLTNLGHVALWDVDAPRLVDVVATLFVDGRAVHAYRTRIGFRDARFETDGFFLNGRRLRLFGLNRHELFPYVGFAMPRRVMRHDAETLRHEFNCNIVRCSHYPQSEAFLDACDELGLMVWEEMPGWQYLGDPTWKDLAVRDVRDMICRDRNHPAIVIWGVRINESRNDPALYQRTTALAKSLDDSRPASGSMTPDSRKTWERDWREDVFAFDDYQTAPDGSVGIAAPLPGVPYLLAEAVGQFSYGPGRKGFTNRYRRAGDVSLQGQQALYHAQAHSKAAAQPRCAGVIAWCAFDYGSLINSHNAVKCPGVADIFRIPKLGATFYQAQADPKTRPVIEPDFYWHFGPPTPRGPGKNSAIFSNCDRLELFVNGQHHQTVYPDAAKFPHLKHPPFFADLDLDDAGFPELRVDGYVADHLILSRAFSSDPARDQFFLQADDPELIGDGSDATRLVFGRADRFGAVRPFGEGDVTFEIAGPGALIGDNPFHLADAGNVGAVWIKTRPGAAGEIIVTATHSSLGTKSAKIHVLALTG